MKAKIDYKSKKNIIIAIIALVVVIAAIILGVAFIKGNDSATAAVPDEISNTETSDNADSGESNTNEVNTETPIDENTENVETPVDNETNNGTANTGNSTTGTGTTGENSGTTTETTNPNVPNQEYTQTTTVVTENPWETKTIGWSPISLSAYTAAANLGINKPNIEINKTAYVNNNTAETVAQKNEKITYVITVENTGKIDATNIRIIDSIPEGTELVADSITNNGIESEGKITWVTDIKIGEKVELTFQVTVVSDTLNLIENTAKVNGQETPTTHTPIITTNKTAQVVTLNSDGEEVLEDRNPKVGETIRYTIILTNTTEYAGTTTVKDNIPAGTTLVEGTISNGGKLDNGTITWENVEVSGNGTTTVSFDVTVNKEIYNEQTEQTEPVKTITNKAVVGNTDTPETTTEVANITTIKTSKTQEGPLHELDTITYEFTATNSGNAEGTVKISDKVPEGTTLVEGSIKIDGKGSYTEAELNEGIEVTLKAGEEKTLSFDVTINPFEGEKIHIVNNVATQDGEEIPGTDDEVEKEYISVSVSKDFVDKDNIDRVRPDSITASLYANGTSIQEIELNEDNNWQHTFEKLNKYDLESK